MNEAEAQVTGTSFGQDPRLNKGNTVNQNSGRRKLTPAVAFKHVGWLNVTPLKSWGFRARFSKFELIARRFFAPSAHMVHFRSKEM